MAVSPFLQLFRHGSCFSMHNFIFSSKVHNNLVLMGFYVFRKMGKTKVMFQVYCSVKHHQEL